MAVEVTHLSSGLYRWLFFQEVSTTGMIRDFAGRDLEFTVEGREAYYLSSAFTHFSLIVFLFLFMRRKNKYQLLHLTNIPVLHSLLRVSLS